jgi:hypothetical protein
MSPDDHDVDNMCVRQAENEKIDRRAWGQIRG